ncbi:hypothetical protein Tdes44962_MAKER09693 [Teratosphaeria destructans]|uniref:Uncharacterized protein n=1 Tax=Teratosphaeria destructans TaxID=418781 RepID=A0A9W7W2L0_9PEZI|nr:hypothetical protein Tdes44962_MAKER09693 [Teratosphaeria destructans]
MEQAKGTDTPTPQTPSKNESATEAVNPDQATTKMSALERLKQRNEASGMKKLLDKTRRIKMFDSTKASKAKTKGSSQYGTIKMQEGSIIITGKSVAAEQYEPDWTTEQLNFIKTMTSTVLRCEDVKDSRRSVMDRDQKYVGRDEGGSLVPTEEAYVSPLDVSEYYVGIGPLKYVITGSPKHYSDAVVAGTRADWMLNQWTSEWVMIEGVIPDMSTKQHRIGAAT